MQLVQRNLKIFVYLSLYKKEIRLISVFLWDTKSLTHYEIKNLRRSYYFSFKKLNGNRFKDKDKILELQWIIVYKNQCEKKLRLGEGIGGTIALNELRAVSSNTSWKNSIAEIVSYIGTSEPSQLWNQEYLRIKSVTALYLSSTRVNCKSNTV